jgi:putative Flp pilus-assembly TadE/G-like protein
MKSLVMKSSALATYNRFNKDCAGNLPIVAALSAIPIIAAAGLAIDYLRAANVATVVQAGADAAALAVASAEDAEKATDWIPRLQSDLVAKLGSDAQDISVTGLWLSATDYQVKVSAEVPVSFMAVMPGMSHAMSVRIESIAQVKVTDPVWKVPAVAELSPEAADYNRIYVYCFDLSKKHTGNLGRSQETAIADNGGTTYTYTMPKCAAGESLSYRLYNVRNSRTNPSVWDNGSAIRYNYYTDTIYTVGVESYDLGGYSMLETVLCDTFDECKDQSLGGVIPAGKNRTPQLTTKACQPGKFMYYGWEDRPPGFGWTDKDYNDIRIIIECPVSGDASGKEVVRLIK